jgi:hypothetical protein
MPIIDTADIARSRNMHMKLNVVANNGEHLFRVQGLKKRNETGSDIMSQEEDEANLARYRRDRRTSIDVDGNISSVTGGGMDRRNAIAIPIPLKKSEINHLQQKYRQGKAERNMRTKEIQMDNRANLYPQIVSKIMYGHTRRENYGTAVWNQWPFNCPARYEPEIAPKSVHFENVSKSVSEC